MKVNDIVVILHEPDGTVDSGQTGLIGVIVDYYTDDPELCYEVKTSSNANFIYTENQIRLATNDEVRKALINIISTGRISNTQLDQTVKSVKWNGVNSDDLEKIAAAVKDVSCLEWSTHFTV